MSINLECLECQISYSKARPPKVLPCGHSICSVCAIDSLTNRNCYTCRTCVTNFDPNTLAMSLPTNILYFDMLEKIDKLFKDNEWKQNTPKQEEAPLAMLKIQEQCLYTFCQRKRFQKDGITELFCSQECQANYEQLQTVV